MYTKESLNTCKNRNFGEKKDLFQFNTKWTSFLKGPENNTQYKVKLHKITQLTDY